MAAVDPLCDGTNNKKSIKAKEKKYSCCQEDNLDFLNYV